MHYTYDDILKASTASVIHARGYRYVIVILARGDTSDNPASTKHSIWGPGVWLWEIHASGVHAREYESVDSIPEALAKGAATLATGSVAARR